MFCTDAMHARRLAGASALVMLLLPGCGSAPPLSPNRPAPAAPSRVEPAPSSQGRAALPAPDRPRSLAQLRSHAAQRVVAANPGRTYDGRVPDILLAIPVLEVELNADGSIRRIEVMRQPRQALDTVQLAIDAVRRAAPFGDVSHLPRPWKFTETFLFNDDRKFKLRSMDQ